MAKKKTLNGGMLREVKITAKRQQKAKPTARDSSVTTHGQVANKTVDSIKKANPTAAKLIGRGWKGSGGMTTYGSGSSDAIQAAMKAGKERKKS